MISKFKSRVISISLVLVMLFSIFAVGQIQAEAASAVSVTVADVSYNYKDTKSIFDSINKYRTEMNCPALAMDTNLMNDAFTRAVELSVYASVVRPNGSKYVGDCSQLIGYNVLSNSSLLYQWQSDQDSLNLLLSTVFKSVGVGVVKVNGYKYVCVLLSYNSSSGFDSNIFNKSNQVMDKPISVLPSLLTNAKTSFTNNALIICGSGVKVGMYVTNSMYPSASVRLTADNMKVTIANPKCFSFNYNTVTAIYPGESLITVSLKDDSSVSASATLRATAVSLEECSFASIPDQYYTGKAITPAISGKDSSGNNLVLNTDYTVEYQNNVNIGTATAVVKGLGKYVSYQKKLNFNIILNSSSVFSVSASVTPAKVILGSSATINASTAGAVDPVKYTYEYAEAGSSSWKTISSSTTSSTCQFKPAEAKSYNVRVTAVDGAGRKASQTASVQAESKMVCQLSLSKDSYALGEKIVMSVTQEGGSSPTYAFMVKLPSSTSWTTLQDFSSVSYYNYVPQNPGEYTVMVKYKSVSGQSGELYKTFKVTGTALANTSSISATSLYLGKSITLKGAATGGSGSYQYAYYYKKSTDTSWTTLQAYSTKNSVAFSPKTDGSYTVSIKVKDSTGKILDKTFTVSCTQAFTNTSTLSASKIDLGQTLTVNVSSNSTNTCTYAVWYHTKGTTGWSLVQDYSSNAKINITPTKSGDFEVCVRVKDSKGNIGLKYLSFSVNPKLKNTSKLSASSVSPNTSLTVSCSASGGTGTYTYLVRYRKSGTSSWTVKQNYSSNASVSLAISATGTYDVNICVRDGLGQVAEVTKTLTVANPIVPKLTLGKSSVVSGQTNTASVTATGGTGGFTYAFYYKNSASENWIEKQKFSSNTKVEMKPTAVGTYDVCVKVKDSSGTVQKAYSTFKVTAAVSVKASLSASTIIKGQTTTVTATASNGSGGYTYSVFMRKSGTEKWVTQQDFKSNNKLAVKPAYDGTYEVCVKAKDSIGGIAKVYLNITVKPSVIAKLSLSPTTIIKGQSNTVTASASSGSGGYTYAVYVKKSTDSKWVEKQAFKSNTKVTWTPVSDGTYDVCVKAKDSIGGISKAYAKLTVKPSVENTSTISATSIKLKSSVTVTASAKNGSGGYTYAVLYKKASSSTWSTVQDFKANTSIKITPATATKYDVCVKAKDSIGTVSKKYFTVTVTQ